MGDRCAGAKRGGYQHRFGDFLLGRTRCAGLLGVNLDEYGHCVLNATAMAISSLYFTGMAPAAMAALSKAINAFIPSGAWASSDFIFARFFMSYMVILRGPDQAGNFR
jgi:hypothetical protein